MFIYNLKINSSILFKIIFTLLILSIIILCLIISIKLFNKSKESTDTCINNCFNINEKNFSSILKITHEDINSYLGLNFKYSGFIYRVYDLDKDKFVLARNMIISSDMQTVIVGFLCEYENALYFKDYSWVELEGTIDKCIYHNEEMPIIKVKSIKEIQKPDNEYVYPPDENYIPTINMF